MLLREFHAMGVSHRGALVLTLAGALTLRDCLRLAGLARHWRASGAAPRVVLVDLTSAQIQLSKGEAQLLLLCIGRLSVPFALVQSAGHGRLAASEWWEKVALQAGQLWTIFSDLQAADAWVQLHLQCGRGCGQGVSG